MRQPFPNLRLPLADSVVLRYVIRRGTMSYLASSPPARPDPASDAARDEAASTGFASEGCPNEPHPRQGGSGHAQ